MNKTALEFISGFIPPDLDLSNTGFAHVKEVSGLAADKPAT